MLQQSCKLIFFVRFIRVNSIFLLLLYTMLTSVFIIKSHLEMAYVVLMS